MLVVNIIGASIDYLQFLQQYLSHQQIIRVPEDNYLFTFP